MITQAGIIVYTWQHEARYCP